MEIFLFRRKRHYHEPVSDGELHGLSVKNFSYQTNKKIKWVKNMYVDWRKYRNSITPGELIFCDLEDITTINESSLVFALCRFLTEVRKLDGSDFPGKTLYDIVICIQFHLEKMGFTYKLLNDDMFSKIRFCLDNLMKKRASEGLGNGVCRAQVLSFTDEDVLWSLGLLGIHSPEVLLNTVVVMLDMSCSLCAGEEYRNLRSPPFNSQFDFLYDKEGKLYLKYVEDLGLKTNKGGIKQHKIEPKEVFVYQLENEERCPVRIINYYLGKLPESHTCTAFYLQPRKNYTPTSWYLNRPVGVNTLRNVVKDLCDKGGIPGYFTNHSLHASSCTRMYANDIEEQIIQEISGHRSLAVRSYKCTSESQRRKASRAIFKKRTKIV